MRLAAPKSGNAGPKRPYLCRHCGRGQVTLTVLVPARLSHTGKTRWARKPIDACIAPIVKALNDAGIFTASCCCGHGHDGDIRLHDGRTLVVTRAADDTLEKAAHAERGEIGEWERSAAQGAG